MRKPLQRAPRTIRLFGIFEITRLGRDPLGRPLHPWEEVTLDQLSLHARLLIAKMARVSARDFYEERAEQLRSLAADSERRLAEQLRAQLTPANCPMQFGCACGEEECAAADTPCPNPHSSIQRCAATCPNRPFCTDYAANIKPWRCLKYTNPSQVCTRREPHEECIPHTPATEDDAR
jgi:hypothetical protein